MNPVQAPFGLIEHIGNAVGAGLAQGIDLVAKAIGIQFIGEQHVGCRIAGGDEIFELVAGIVPAAAGIDISRVGHGAKHRPPVTGVAHKVEKGVVAAALLPHESQQVFLVVAVGVVADPEAGRGQGRTCHRHGVGTRLAHGREIPFVIMVETPARGVEFGGACFKHSGARFCVEEADFFANGFLREENGHFFLCGKIAQLVDADVDDIIGLWGKQRAAILAVYVHALEQEQEERQVFHARKIRFFRTLTMPGFSPYPGAAAR